MNCLRSIFVWKSNVGKFPWYVGASREKVVGRMRTRELALEFAEKLKGKSNVSYIEQKDPKGCLHFDSNAKIHEAQPVS